MAHADLSPDGVRRNVELNRRFRLEFLADSEDGWRRRLGRPLTNRELKVVLLDYPGDIAENPGLPRPADR